MPRSVRPVTPACRRSRCHCDLAARRRRVRCAGTPSAPLLAALLLLATAACITRGSPPAPPPASSETVEVGGPVRHDFPYDARWVEVGGQRMHFVESGEGAPVLFLHGNPTWSYLWRHVMPELADKGRLIAVDLVGFGRSDQPSPPFGLAQHIQAVDGFIEALELEDVLLVGHDWGSALALAYAARHPQNVRGVALMEAILPAVPGEPDVPAAWAGRLDEMWPLFLDAGAPRQSRALVIDDNIFIERLLPLSVCRTLTDDELDAYREPFLDPVTRMAILELRLAVGSSASRQITSDAVGWILDERPPVLLLGFEPGVLGTNLQREWVRRNLPSVEIAMLGEGLHFVQEDKGPQIGRTIAEWMDRRGLAATR